MQRETAVLTALPGVVRFTVPGPPVAAARPRITAAGGFARAYAPRSNVEYAQWVRLAFEEQHPGFEPVERGVPIRLTVTFWMPRPKSHYGSGRNAGRLKVSAPLHHVARPDLDNLLKLVKDALKGVAWHDDSQVCEYDDCSKFYASGGRVAEPCTAVTFRAVQP